MSAQKAYAITSKHYLLLATIHSENTTAVAISIAHAASPQPHRIKTIPATVTGAMAAAATPTRESQHPATFKNHLFSKHPKRQIAVTWIQPVEEVRSEGFSEHRLRALIAKGVYWRPVEIQPAVPNQNLNRGAHMAIWLASWAGDNAGPVIGRQNNRLLVSLTISDGTFPAGLFQRGNLQGKPWYFEVYVSCLTPGARDAIAIACDQQNDSYVWSIEVAEVDWGLGKAPWLPGINLFSVMLLASGGHQSGTIASARIDNTVTSIDMSQQQAQSFLTMAMRVRPR